MPSRRAASGRGKKEPIFYGRLMLAQVHAFHKTYINRKFISIFILGFASGLPLALTSSALQAWFTGANASIVAIGFLGLLGQPYVYKFLWSPLIDRYVIPILGRRRGWVAVMQVLLIITIASMALYSPGEQPWTLAILGLGVALFSATQDVALDAYRTDVLLPDERGVGAASWVGGYRIAMLISGGVGFIVADSIGWPRTYLLMALLMCIGLVTTVFSPSEANGQIAPKSLYDAVIEPFKNLWDRLPFIWICLFIILYKLGDAFALTLTTPFLLRGLHFSLTDIGLVVKGVGLLATLIGVFLGGSLMNKLGMFRALLFFGILQAISNLCFMILAMVGHNITLMTVSIFIEQLCGGLGTAAFLSFLMLLCDHRYTATQFALLSALSAVGRVFVGPFAGIMVAHIGWISFYFGTFLFALPGLLVLVIIRLKYTFSEQGLVTTQ